MMMGAQRDVFISEVSVAIGKLQAVNWHIINNTVNEEIVPHLLKETITLLRALERILK